ncbi:aldose 1-epimerase [Segetibacter sp. 3557_3]|uniref:aldose 1-epimerase n=1 Tax=Segetibacter sp. 3557_3 TaxID=2547429 RepID=UPI001058CEC4|nr:aldose 1-epimerase [Segetibacter sp. 3557_3]TDH23048.1 aldose 1-epimerase [Segetibacter sp. 3557_3]
MPFKTNIPSASNPGIIVLTDSATGSFVEIYTLGALLNQYCVKHESQLVNVIDGYHSPTEAITGIKSTFKSAKLSPFPGRLRNNSYRFGERMYTLPSNWGGHAINGLLYDQEFAITETRNDDHCAVVRLAVLYDGNCEGFPFSYKCEVEYELQPDNMLKLTTCIYNTGDKLLPIADGWHPYFTLGGSINDYQLEFQGKQSIILDHDLIPTGELIPNDNFSAITTLGNVHLDNSFVLNFAECQPMCVIRNPKNRLAVEIRPSRSYPYLHVYTPPHRQSIAIENLSAAPNTFNNGIGLRVLEPGQSGCFTTTFVTKTY